MTEKMVLGFLDLYKMGNPYFTSHLLHKKEKKGGADEGYNRELLSRCTQAMTEIAAAGLVLQTKPVNPNAYFHYFKTFFDAWNDVAFSRSDRFKNAGTAERTVAPLIPVAEDVREKSFLDERPTEAETAPVASRKNASPVTVAAGQAKVPGVRRKKTRSDRKRVENLFIPLKGFLDNH
jgi:hypothetical protein